jgi:hypothetical protein
MFIGLLYQVGRTDEDGREKYYWNAGLDKNGVVDNILEQEENFWIIRKNLG